MPSPLAHLGMGYALYRLGKSKLPGQREPVWKMPLRPLIVMGLSMVPDLDIILAIVFRNMEKYHNSFTHSLYLAIPVALLATILAYWVYRSSFLPWFLIGVVSYDLHVIMDFFTAERGVLMFWPFSPDRFASPVKLFYGLQWGLGWFSPWHLWTLLTESVFVIVLMLAVGFLEKRVGRPVQRPAQEPDA
jgi:membrane-bound metal-dependent hydrolase YbcI (DUF457 family)